jgi:hypothetical protein
LHALTLTLTWLQVDAVIQQANSSCPALAADLARSLEVSMKLVGTGLAAGAALPQSCCCSTALLMRTLHVP